MSYTFVPSGIHGGGFQNVIDIDPKDPNRWILGGDVAGFHVTANKGVGFTTSNGGLYSDNHISVASVKYSPVSTSSTQTNVVVGLVGSRGVVQGTDCGVVVSVAGGLGGWSFGPSNGPIGSGANNQSQGPLPSTHPRSTGNLIEIDSVNNLMFVGGYNNGLRRIGFNALTGAFTGSWLTIGLNGEYIRSIIKINADTYLVATYDARVYQINNARAASPSVTQLSSAPTNIEEFWIESGFLFGVCSTPAASTGAWRVPLTSLNSWTKINGTGLDTTQSQWQSITGYTKTTGEIVLYVGANNAITSKIGGVGANIAKNIMRCDDARKAANMVTWDSPTYIPDSSVNYTMGGPSGEVWWESEHQVSAMINRGVCVPSQLKLGPVGSSNPTFLGMVGRATAWRLDNPTVTNPTQSIWYPCPYGLNVTINRSVAYDPVHSGGTAAANVDWVSFYSSDHLLHVREVDSSPNAGFGITFDPVTGRMYTAVGHRDDPTGTNPQYLGKLTSFAYPPQYGPGTDEGIDLAPGTGSGVPGVLADVFSRNVTDGWGNTSSDAKTYKYLYTGSFVSPGPQQTAFDVSSANGGTVKIPAGNGSATARLYGSTDFIADDPDVVSQFDFSANAVGGFHAYSIQLRSQQPTTNTYYEVRVYQLANGTTTIRFYRSWDGTLGDLKAESSSLGLTPGVEYYIRTRVTGTTTLKVSAKIWRTTDNEPAADNLSWTDTGAVTAGDNPAAGKITTAGGIGWKFSGGTGYTTQAIWATHAWYANDLTGGSGGTKTGYNSHGERSLDVAVGRGLANPIILVAAETHILAGFDYPGGWARKADANHWDVLSTPDFGGQATKSAIFAWPKGQDPGDDQIVYCYDRADGIYRSLTSGISAIRIHNGPSNSEYTGYIVAKRSNPNVLFANIGGNLYRIDNAGTCAANSATLTNLNVTRCGPIALDKDDNLYVTRRTTGANQQAELLFSDTNGASFTNIADIYYRGAGGFVISMCVDDDYFIIIGSKGVGAIVGIPDGIVNPPPDPDQLALDAYGRTTSNGWGSADVGGAYTTGWSGGIATITPPASNFSVGGGFGVMVTDQADDWWRYAVLEGVDDTDEDEYYEFKTDKQPVGGFVEWDFCLRWIAFHSHYRLSVRALANGQMKANISKSVGPGGSGGGGGGGLETDLSTLTTLTGLTHTANTLYKARFRVTGATQPVLQGKAWLATDAEPTNWTITAIDPVGSFTHGAVGMRSHVTASATNTPITFRFDNLDATTVSGGGPPPPPPPPPEAIASDTFFRAGTDGWGTAELGGDYTHSAQISEFIVNSNTGRIVTATNDGLYRFAALQGAVGPNIDGYVTIATDKLAVGGNQNFGVAGRWTDENNHYRMGIQFTTSQVVSVSFTKRVAGVDTILQVGSPVAGLTHAANATYKVRLQIVGTGPVTIRGKIWLASGSEPSTWIESGDASSSLATGGFGLRSTTAAGATNYPVTYLFSSLLVNSIEAPPPPPPPDPQDEVGEVVVSGGPTWVVLPTTTLYPDTDLYPSTGTSWAQGVASITVVIIPQAESGEAYVTGGPHTGAYPGLIYPGIILYPSVGGTWAQGLAAILSWMSARTKTQVMPTRLMTVQETAQAAISDATPPVATALYPSGGLYPGRKTFPED